MKIAIVGGGAAGLTTAYLLSGHHDLTLFESAPVLGGNIRTLNRNVSCPSLDHDLVLDAGVIEFEERRFPYLGRLLDELGVERRAVPGTTALFLADGRCYRSPRQIEKSRSSRSSNLLEYSKLLRLLPAHRRFVRRIGAAGEDSLIERDVGSYLDDGPHGIWLRMLLMYAYSIEFAETSGIPAALAIPMLRAFIDRNDWTSIRGGTYAYVQRLIEATTAKIHVDTRVVGISRMPHGILVRLADGEELRFDAIVLATTPEQVLRLLRDPTPQERRRFSAWRRHLATTIVHWDTGLYERRRIESFSEFDLFELENGRAGYNAYLNRLSGVPDHHGRHYFLAFDLDAEIDPDRVIHVQQHATPSYTVAALRHRREVIETNGTDRTFHVGAWLGDGLHEGAVRSALRVSKLLGGATLGGSHAREDAKPLGRS